MCISVAFTKFCTLARTTKIKSYVKNGRLFTSLHSSQQLQITNLLDSFAGKKETHPRQAQANDSCEIEIQEKKTESVFRRKFTQRKC